jgi:hypothetical protein
MDDMMEERAREMAHKDMQGSVGQRHRDTRHEGAQKRRGGDAD